MTLEEAIKSLKEHGIKCTLKSNKEKTLHILLSGDVMHARLSGVFTEAEFENIVPWLKNGAFKWYGIELE